MNTLRKNLLKVLTLSLAAFSFLYLSACINVLSPEMNPAEGMGVVRVTIGDNARTILPTQIGDLHYILTFTRPDDTASPVVRNLGTGTTDTVDLSQGEWSLDVRGYTSNPGANPIPSQALVYATQTINVNPGGNNVQVQLSLNEDNLSQTGTGTLSYSLTLPFGAEGTLEVFRVQVMGGVLVQNPTAVLTANLDAGLNEDDEELSSGFYNIYVNLVLGDRGTTWRELAHIYDGTVTTAEKLFGVSDINSPLSGRITAIYFEGFVVGGVFGFGSNDIYIDVPAGTNLTNLKAVIDHEGIVITPSPQTTTDFTNPVVFTVHGAGFENPYTVHAVSIAALNEKMYEANTLRNVPTVATSAGEVLMGDSWVTSAEMEAFDAAISAAHNRLMNLGSQVQIDAATAALNAAMLLFNSQIKYGTSALDMAPLTARIDAAIAEKADVLVNSNAANVSSSAFWVTDTEMSTFNAAIAAAEHIRNNPSGVSSEQLNTAIQTLNTAITTFQEQKKNGTAWMGINQRAVRITGLPYPNGAEVGLGLFSSIDTIDLAINPEVYGDGNPPVQNGEVSIALVFGEIISSPWTGGGSWHIGFMIELSDGTTELWMSNSPHNFSTDPFPTIPFSTTSFTQSSVFPATLGSLVGGANEFQQIFGAASITMETFVQTVFGASWDEFLAAIVEMGMIISKTENLQTPFNRSDIVSASTFIYTNYPFWWEDDDRREKIGEMVGTVSLTHVPNDVRRIEIRAHGQAPVQGGGTTNWTFGSSRIWTPGNSTSNIPWSLPIYLNDQDNWDPKIYTWEFTYVLIVELQGNRIYEVPVNNTPRGFSFSSPQPVNVGDIGSVDLRYVTLSGTMNISYNGAPVPRLLLTEAVMGHGTRYESGFNPTGTTGIPWQMLVARSDSARDIFIRIMGVPQNSPNNWNNNLFFDFIYPIPVHVPAGDQGNSNIVIDIGNLAQNTIRVINAPGGNYQVYVTETFVDQWSIDYIINNMNDINAYTGSGSGPSVSLTPLRPPEYFNNRGWFNVLIVSGSERKYINGFNFHNGVGFVDWNNMAVMP